MDKQTYEDLYSTTNSTTKIITSSYLAAMEQIFELFELDGVHENIERLNDFIESQKPLEIVEGGVYIQLKEMYAAVAKHDTFRRIRVMYTESDTPIKLIVTKVTEESVYFKYENGCFEHRVLKDQFNQHNFMKVEEQQ